MEWDKKIAAKYKELSIKTSAEMIVGKTYYSNGWGSLSEPFTYLGKVPADKICIDKEFFFLQPLQGMLAGFGPFQTSFNDNNIDGSGYNPWFIFETEELAKQCRQELNKTIYFEPDYMYSPSYDYYDDYEDIDFPMEEFDYN